MSNIMDEDSFHKFINDKIHEFKLKGKPFCERCAVRDFRENKTVYVDGKWGMFSQIPDLTKYTKDIEYLNRRMDVTDPMQKGRNVIIGSVLDFCCKFGHGVSVNFNLDELEAGGWNKKVV